MHYGKLATATTVKVVDTVSGVTNIVSFASNESISFRDNGVVFSGTLATATTVKVVDTVSGVTNTFSFTNTNIYFHKNWVVSLGTLDTASTDTRVGGTPFSFTNTNITFHDNGVVYRGTLATEKIISGNTYVANTSIIFDTDGNLIQGRTSATEHNYVIKGTPFSFDTVGIRFHDNWVVKSGTLTNGDVVSFNRDGVRK